MNSDSTVYKDQSTEMELDDNHGQPHFAYFCNSKCEYFPCHHIPENGFFNCLFCYCPLYALGSKCGGGFKYIEGGIKDCSNCTLPHSEIGYAYITKKYAEIMELARCRDD